MANFNKTEGGGGNVDTSAASAELARLQRIGQYTEVIFPRKSGGGGGGAVSAAAWSNLKSSFDQQITGLEKDLGEVDKSYKMGLVNGAQRDALILQTFDDFTAKLSKFSSDNAEILKAKSVSAPTQVSDWLESAQKTLNRTKADYGALETPEKFTVTQSAETTAKQDDLIERAKFFTSKDANGQTQKWDSYAQVNGYTYDDSVVGQDKKVNQSLAQSKAVTVDVWGPNGYEQKSLSELNDDNYVFDKDPYTGGNTFYAVVSKPAETEKNVPQLQKTSAKDKWAYVKGVNNTPILVKLDESSGTRQYLYVKDTSTGNYGDAYTEPQKLGADQTMAALSGVPFSAWDAYPQKDMAKELFRTLSQFPADGSWVKDNLGKVYKFENGQLRYATGAILDSYKRASEFDDSIAKEVPGSFFNQNRTGPELRSFDVESTGNAIVNGQYNINPDAVQNSITNQAQSFSTGITPPTPQTPEQIAATDRMKQLLTSFMAPRFSDIKSSFTQPTTSTPETQAGPTIANASKITQPYVPQFAKGLFEQFR